MPNYKSHVVGGVGAFVIVVSICLFFMLPSMLTLCEWLSCAVLGSLFPDVDIYSKGRQLYNRALVVMALLFVLFAKLSYFPLLALAFILPHVVVHRGIFHRTWFIVVCCVSAIGVVRWCIPAATTTMCFDMLFFAAGAISHIWLDSGLKGVVRIK